MRILSKFWPEKIKKTVITLKALKFKLSCLSQTCILSKSIMQLMKTPFFSDSVDFIEKKWVENRLWEKVNFCGGKTESSYVVTIASENPWPIVRRIG